MNTDTRKALELARETLEWPAVHDADVAIAAIDAALSAPDLNLSDTAVQKRLAAQWGYVPAPDPAAPVALTWYEGAPPFPQDQEWFIAETIHGDRVVLRSLNEGSQRKQTYNFKTADETYMATRIIKRWMQFPDCDYLPPVAPAAPVAQPLDDITTLQAELWKLAVRKGLVTVHTEQVATPDPVTKVSWLEGHAKACDVSNDAARRIGQEGGAA